MTDRPSPEQQLAEVIYDVGTVDDHEEATDLAAAIVAAVNNGDIDPIVPENAVDRALRANRDAELAELRALKKALIPLLEEVYELRTLKAKVEELEMLVAQGLDFFDKSREYVANPPPRAWWTWFEWCKEARKTLENRERAE